MEFYIEEENNKWKLMAKDDDKIYKHDFEVCRLIKENFMDFKLKLSFLKGRLNNGKFLFDSKDDAQEAINWIESVYIMNKLLNTEKLNYFKMQSENILRILNEPQEIKIHFIRDIYGHYKRIFCLENKCLECQQDNSPLTQYEVEVMDVADGEVKLLTANRRLINSLISIIQEFGDPQNYNIKIIKSGTGINTNYNVFKIKEEII